MEQRVPTTEPTPVGIAEPTHWHLILGMLLKALLEAVGVTVQIETPVTRKPLKLDILLIRHEGAGWTAEQRIRLPDGIRQRREPNILCEFKYTESVNRDALVQALNYETLYRLGNELPERAIATFVVSGKTPQRKFLAEIVAGLRSLFAEVEEETMTTVNITPEYVQSLGAGIRRMIVNTLSPQERLEGLTHKDLLERLTPKQRLEGLAPETIIAQFTPEDLLARLEPAVIEAYLRRQAVLEQKRATATQPTRKTTVSAKPKTRKARKRPSS